MAVRNQQTGLYEARKLFSTGHEYVGIGSSKEEAKVNLAKQLKEIEIDYGPYQDESQRNSVRKLVLAGRLPKYNPPLKQIGTFSSPGFEMKLGEDGKFKYEFNPDRAAPLFSRDLTAQEAVNQIDQVRNHSER